MVSNSIGWYVVVKIVGGKTYSISRKNGKEVNSNLQLGACTTINFPQNNTVILDNWRTDTQNNSKKLNIETSKNAKYLFIGLAGGNTTTITEEIQKIATENLIVKIEEQTTDYIEHQQTDYLLYIQQEMLEGDYFVKEADGWKELHNKPELTLDGSDDEEWVLSEAFSNVFVCNKPADLIGYETDLICNITDNFVTNGETLNSLEHGIAVGSKINIKLANINTLEELKQYLSTTNIKLYYKSTHETKLPCTEEQSAVLDELNNLDLFEGVNNIITAENIAKMKLYYIANAKKYIDKETSDIKEQINTINELLSTTGTSSLLLDNLQSDLESEVM